MMRSEADGAASRGAIAAEAAQSEPTASPDAALLRAVDQFLAANIAYGETCWAPDKHDDGPEGADRAETLAQFDAASASIIEFGNEIIESTAQTITGFRAKAQATIAFFDGALPRDSIGVVVLCSLANDLTARPG